MMSGERTRLRAGNGALAIPTRIDRFGEPRAPPGSERLRPIKQRTARRGSCNFVFIVNACIPVETKSDPKLNIGHVLFMDIVGYSKLLISEQSELIRQLKEIVCGTEQFRSAETAGKLK